MDEKFEVKIIDNKLVIKNKDPEYKKILAPRQMVVAELIIQGFTDREISDILELAYSTVRTYTRDIYKKMNVNNRVNLVYAMLEINKPKI